jgi:hypothetical protein
VKAAVFYAAGTAVGGIAAPTLFGALRLSSCVPRKITIEIMHVASRKDRGPPQPGKRRTPAASGRRFF